MVIDDNRIVATDSIDRFTSYGEESKTPWIQIESEDEEIEHGDPVDAIYDIRAETEFEETVKHIHHLHDHTPHTEVTKK